VYSDRETIIASIIVDFEFFARALPSFEGPSFRGFLLKWDFDCGQHARLKAHVAPFAEGIPNKDEVLRRVNDAIEHCVGITSNELRPRLKEALRFLTRDNENRVEIESLGSDLSDLNGGSSSSDSSGSASHGEARSTHSLTYSPDSAYGSDRTIVLPRDVKKCCFPATCRRFKQQSK